MTLLAQLWPRTSGAGPTPTPTPAPRGKSGKGCAAGIQRGVLQALEGAGRPLSRQPLRLTALS